MNKDSNFIEYISPNVAAKKLGIAVTTLRKYSSLIEKTSGNKSYFNRDSNNSRLYTNSDVSVLKRIVALKVRPDFSLEKSIKQALSENDVSDVSDTDTRFESDTSNDMQPIQEDKIQQYESLINQLVESNLKLSGQLEIAIEKIENHNKKLLELEQAPIEKTNFLNRFFKK
jgi:DNA-binding transcriptional MerR regulator